MNLSKILLSGLLIIFALISDHTNAQTFSTLQNGVRFEISSDFSTPPTLGSQSNTVSYETLSIIPLGGPPPGYVVTLSISMTEAGLQNDLMISDFVLNFDDQSQSISSSEGSLEFSLPSPGVVTTAPELRGVTRTAADWIGQYVYCTLCVDDNCVVTQARIHPDPLTLLAAPDDEVINQLKLYWEALRKDSADKPMGAGHRVTVTSQFDGSVAENRFIPKVPDSQLVIFDGNPSNFLTLDQNTLTPGEAYRVSVSTCAADQSICGGAKEIENLRAFALFPTPTANAQGGITVTWQKFSNSTADYRLARCEVNSTGGSSNCIIKIVPDNNTTSSTISYPDNDTQIEPGKSYRYQISACIGTSNCSSGSEIRTGDTGIVDIPLVSPDEYENDDDPTKLTQSNQLIKGNADQPRNFHTADDVDWTKIELKNASRELEVFTSSSDPEVNTELTLFNASGQTIACAGGTANEFTGHAKLLLPRLPPGVYLLRIKQRFIGSTLNPVERYSLNAFIRAAPTSSPIEGSCNGVDGFPGGSKASIVPILNLLLE